ncbi:MAG: tRNA (N6-isopentenyl adenosine(37)-C2)-methylthiotransferase MiaB [Rickettsiales bacterium]|nr:tRNA (N6-isopentenyl adenosine(37)-C2)-methylthiotransferase MiaB [Rickettsiales bacterium]
MKKLYIKTFGCQMNVYDSSRMADILQLKGYESTDKIEECDIFIMNTCHIREKASEKIFSELGKIKKIKQKKIENGEYLIVIVAGCVAKADGAEIFKRMPIVDIVVSGESYHNIGDMVDKVLQQIKNEEKTHVIDIDFKTQEKFASLPSIRNVKSVSENIAVQAGCDKFCSYCVVPYTRGREYSRGVEEIIEEAKILVDAGVKEINLLGQNVDNYNGKDKNGRTTTLAELIYKVNDINGIERIRYTTSYPSQFGDDLIFAHKDLKKLMPFIHLPAQAGSNKTLKAMNRKYTREQYLELVEKIRKHVPDVAISSDFIVGFAGETEEDFLETLSLVEQVKYASSFSFKYSPRPNTVGIKMPNQIDENIKAERLDRLQAVLDQQQIDFNRNCIGKTMEVLIENPAENNEKLFFGRTPYLQAVIIKSNRTLNNGDILNVKITDANLRTLEGEAN